MKVFIDHTCTSRGGGLMMIICKKNVIYAPIAIRSLFF